MLVDELLHVGSSCIGSLLRLYTVEEWWLKEFSRINKLMYIDSINGIMSITTDNHLFSLFFFFGSSKALTMKVHGVMHLHNKGCQSRNVEHMNYAVIKINVFFSWKLSNHCSCRAGELVIHHCNSCKKLSCILIMWKMFCCLLCTCVLAL